MAAGDTGGQSTLVASPIITLLLTQAKEQGRTTMEEMKAVTVEEEEVAVTEDEKVAGGEGLHAVEGEEGEGLGDDDNGDGEGATDKGDEEEEEERWAKHYSSAQEILLVGEGDFSFSLSLATSFRSASNIVATSLDSYSDVTSKYGRAKSNLDSLKEMGATLLHGIDATRMQIVVGLKMRRFDRIIFNFPHAGFKGKEDDIQLINLHKQLVYGFFRNASRMLRQGGQVHITHKTSFPFCHWKLEELASSNSLVLFKRANFKIEDYPGYSNKRGDGFMCDEPFPLGECCTFMFRLGKPLTRKRASSNVPNLCGITSSDGHLPQRVPNCVPIASDAHLLPATERPTAAGRFLLPLLPGRPQLGYITELEDRRIIDRLRSEIFEDYMTDAQIRHGSSFIDPDFSSQVDSFLRSSCEVYMKEGPGRTIHGYIAHLRELHRSSALRTAWLRRMLVRRHGREMGGGEPGFGEPLVPASFWC